MKDGTLWELVAKSEKTVHEKMLVQAVAILTTRDGYTHMLPEEVWDHVKAMAVVTEDLEARGAEVTVVK